MRINSGITSGIGAVRSKGDAAPSVRHSDTADVASAIDVFSVSSSAQLAAAAHEKIKEIPSVRSSLIESIQSQLNSDSYRPDPNAVVDGLLKEHLQPALG
jgi:anti-sigma28 factor (negative regulator of flagellin synthesis)